MTFSFFINDRIGQILQTKSDSKLFWSKRVFLALPFHSLDFEAALCGRLSTFVLLVLCERLHAGHQDVIVAQKLVEQEAAEAVTEALVLHGI